MNAAADPIALEPFRSRQPHAPGDRRLLNHLPLAHRIAGERAGQRDGLAEYLLGQALVGLVEAFDAYASARTSLRFGAFAEPFVHDALDRPRVESEVTQAHARIADTLASRTRTHQLAAFLDVPTDALVGGLMDAVAADPPRIRHLRLVGAA